VFASIVLFYTGYPILRGAYVSLRARQPNMDLLVSLAAVSSYAYSTLAMFLGRTDLYFDVTIAVILVVTAGNHYESLIKRRATGALSGAHDCDRPRGPNRGGRDGRDGAVAPAIACSYVPASACRSTGSSPRGCRGRRGPGHRRVAPGDETRGDAVRGGTVVTDAPIVVEVGEDAESTLDTLVRMLWEIQSSRSGIQRLVDKLATVFVPLVVAVAVLAAGATLAFGASPTEAALVGLTVLIVSCPCALGLATR